MRTLVYGYSDDLIEIEGPVSEEFYYDGDGDRGDLLAFSNGTVLRIHFHQVWRITHVAGPAPTTLEQCPEDDDDNYSDKATLPDGITWVVRGDVIGKLDR